MNIIIILSLIFIPVCIVFLIIHLCVKYGKSKGYDDKGGTFGDIL